MVKICPHNSTGRADYFGAVVNRAARLLCAAKPGQVLIEENVMEAVIKEWTQSGVSATSDAQPVAAGLTGNRPSLDAHLKRLVGFSTLFQPTRLKEQAGSASASDGGSQPAVPAPLAKDDAFELSSRSRSVPLNAIRRMNILSGVPAPTGQSKVSFEGLSSGSPRQSLDSSSRLNSLDLATPTDQVLESSCPPYAAKSPLAVSNCHMLKFLQASGPVLGRKESGVMHGSKYRSLASTAGQDAALSSRRLLSTAGNSLDPGFKLSLSLLDRQVKTPNAQSPTKGWVRDESHSSSDSTGDQPTSIASVPAQKGKPSRRPCHDC